MSSFTITKMARFMAETFTSAIQKISDVVVGDHDRARFVNRVPIVENRRGHYVDSFATASNEQGHYLAQPIASGLDAGIAAALGLIPENSSRLSLRLHFGNIDDQSLNQIRTELFSVSLSGLGPSDRDALADTETAWWASMSSVCMETGVDADIFGAQIALADKIQRDPAERLNRAVETLYSMTNAYTLKDGVPVVNTRKGADGKVVAQDGGLFGAYLAGYRLGVQEMDGIFLIGSTESLDNVLGNFSFSNEKDEFGRGKSGKINSSLYKAADLVEAMSIVGVLKDSWGALKNS